MDVFSAIKGRRSCRDFLPDPLEDRDVVRIIEAGSWAPSPKNAQPWEFIVIRNEEIKQKIYEEAEERRKWFLEKGGWKWLGKYSVDFLLKVPVIVVVVGDPEKTGVDKFLQGDWHGVPAAFRSRSISLLAAHALELPALV